jgi:hypothetical protein
MTGNVSGFCAYDKLESALTNLSTLAGDYANHLPGHRVAKAIAHDSGQRGRVAAADLQDSLTDQRLASITAA